MKIILLIGLVVMMARPAMMFGAVAFDKPFAGMYGPMNITYNYTNKTMTYYESFDSNYSFDKIDSLSWIVVANQTNYSYSMFCWHNTNHSLTVYRHTCSLICEELIEFSMFVNYCEIHIWHDDYYNGTILGTIGFDMNATVAYEGGPIRNPFDPTAPSPVPSPAAVQAITLGPWEIFGIVIGCVAFIALGGVGAWFGRRRWIARRVAIS